MGAKSRRKGVRGELEAAEVMRDLWPNVRRRAMQARGGSEGADLENTPGYHVEVGCGNVNPRAKWEQAQADAFRPYEDAATDAEARALPPIPTPIALTHRDRGHWIVTMHVSDFKALVRKATSRGEGKSESGPEAQGGKSRYRETRYTEIATDTRGAVLWREPYRLSRLNGPGERIVWNSRDYEVVSSAIVGQEIHTVLRDEQAGDQ